MAKRTSKRQVCVEVVRYDRGKKDRVVKRPGPMSERKADKVDNGLNINLNHEMFFTRIVPASKRQNESDDNDSLERR